MNCSQNSKFSFYFLQTFLLSKKYYFIPLYLLRNPDCIHILKYNAVILSLFHAVFSVYKQFAMLVDNKMNLLEVWPFINILQLYYNSGCTCMNLAPYIFFRIKKNILYDNCQMSIFHIKVLSKS